MTRSDRASTGGTKRVRIGVATRGVRVTATVAAGVAAIVLLTGGVPWVQNKSVPEIDGREPLSESQRADEAYVRGRESFVQALEFEEKAAAATSDGKRRRYEAKAKARYRASADAYEVSRKRALKQDYNPDYLPRLYLEMAGALFRTGQYELAHQRYVDALTIAPAFLSARYGLARAQLATGRFEDVRSSFDTLLTEADTRSEAWDYVDALMADIGLWLEDETALSRTPQTMDTMQRWHSATTDELTDTIRWSALDDAEDSP